MHVFRLPVLFISLLILASCAPRPATLNLPAAPVALAMDAQGRTLYVACENPNALLRLAWPSGKITKQAALPGTPGRIYLSPDQTRLRVLCPQAKTMFTYAAPDLALSDTFPLPEPAAAWAEQREPQRQEYFACPDSNVIRPFIGKNPLPPVETGHDPVDLLLRTESDQLWSANVKHNSLTVASLAQGRAMKHVAVWPNPRKLLRSTQADRIYVLCAGNDAVPSRSQIQLVDVNYQKAGLLWPAGEDARDMVADPEQRVLIVAGKDALTIVSQEDGRLLKTEKTGRDPQALAMSPDGRNLAVASRGERQIWIHQMGTLVE